jgi:hypothetical protein
VAQTDEFPSHLGSLYQDAVDSLRFYKQQQWNVTNYSLLIYAAVYFLGSAHDPSFLKTCMGKAILSVIVTVAWIASWVVLSQLESSIVWVRDRVDTLHEHYFTKDERSLLELNPKHRWTDHLVFGLLMLVSVIGAAILWLAIWRASTPAQSRSLF